MLGGPGPAPSAVLGHAGGSEEPSRSVVFVKAVVFCEVTDPWSYLGATRFERAAGMFTILTGEPVEIVYRAAEASPLTDDDVERATAAARISAVPLDLAERVPAATGDAWRLLTWAAESDAGAGDPELAQLGIVGTSQRDLLQQLWRAHLQEGADVSDPLVLSSRAALAGLPLETADAVLASTDYVTEVARQREAAAEVGAHDLPFIVVDGDQTLAGLLSQDDYLQALNHVHQRR